jgi:hypothetical protein
MLPRIYRKETASTSARFLQYTRRKPDIPNLCRKKRRTIVVLSRKDLDDTVSARAYYESSVAAPADVAHAFAPHSAM